jgi:hypothetical protein
MIIARATTLILKRLWTNQQLFIETCVNVVLKDFSFRLCKLFIQKLQLGLCGTEGGF